MHVLRNAVMGVTMLGSLALGIYATAAGPSPQVTPHLVPAADELVPCPGSIEPDARTSPDALPAAASATSDFAHVDAVRRDSEPRLRSWYEDVTAVQTAEGGGFVWSDETGAVTVERVRDYAIRVVLATRAACPSGTSLHLAYEGIPVQLGTAASAPASQPVR